MPFPTDVKTRMFVRCARLCCLCYKPCGVNIEAAHIIAEADGGPNTEDNGIPVCMDCHTEISHYDPRQPKGNKFRDDELRARRDQVYALVDKGVLQAQIVAQHVRRSAGPKGPDVAALSQTAATLENPGTDEARAMLARVKAGSDDTKALARKFGLLARSDAAFVVDSLARESQGDRTSLEGLCRVLDARVPDRESAQIVLEQVVRRQAISGSTESKIVVTSCCGTAILCDLPEALRTVFFEDLFEIVDEDTFRYVNPLVPALVRHVDAIPSGLHQRYVLTLLTQSRSRATTGSRAAREALRDLPDSVVRASLPAIDAEYLGPIDRYETARAFLKQHNHLVTAAANPMLRDLIDLPKYNDFWQRYIRPLHAEVAIDGPPPNPEPSGLQSRALEVVTETYLCTGNSSLRREVQLELDNEPRAEVAAALIACTPSWLRRTAEYPEEQYVPTLRGALATSQGPAVSAFIMEVVRYLGKALRQDRTMRSYTSEALTEELGTSSPPVPFMSAVITLAKLGVGGGGKGWPLTSFNTDVPTDVVALIDCKTIDEVLALRPLEP